MENLVNPIKNRAGWGLGSCSVVKSKLVSLLSTQTETQRAYYLPKLSAHVVHKDTSRKHTYKQKVIKNKQTKTTGLYFLFFELGEKKTLLISLKQQ